MGLSLMTTLRAELLLYRAALVAFNALLVAPASLVMVPFKFEAASTVSVINLICYSKVQ